VPSARWKMLALRSLTSRDEKFDSVETRVDGEAAAEAGRILRAELERLGLEHLVDSDPVIGGQRQADARDDKLRLFRAEVAKIGRAVSKTVA
jgi:hypothetical protein